MCTEQTGREARGEAAVLCLGQSVFSRDKQSVAACNFSGIGVTPFLTDEGD